MVMKTHFQIFELLCK